MKGLTAKQQQVLDFIEEFRESNGYAPTVRETAAHFEVAIKTAHDHIKALERKKAISSIAGKSRAIDIRQSPREEMLEVPILGRVAAGFPLLAEENRDGTMTLPCSLLGKGQFFAVRVFGESMKNAGILDGDLAILKQQNNAENGEIIVALIDEAYTLKRFYKEKNRINLVSENPDFSNIYSRDVKIIGKLVHLVRSYV